MEINDLGHQGYPLLRWHVRQADNSGMRRVMEVNQQSKVSVNGDKNAVFGFRYLQ